MAAVPRRWVCFGAALLALLLAQPAIVTAQERPADPFNTAPPPTLVAGRSLLIPGWGQHRLGQRRWIGYAVVEAGLWALWAERRAGGSDLRTQYRDLAWQEGRVQTGPRVDADWAYYERLSTWTRSGHFDRDPQQAGVQPEENASTYNGWIWGLARGLYFHQGQTPSEDDPAYGQALAYYLERAYGPGFLWDWAGKETSLAEFNHLIDRSDDRFRQATAAMGAVFANHLLSAADAYLSARTSRPTGIRVMTEPWGRGARWTMALRVSGLR
jgi:hypothetical protein